MWGRTATVCLLTVALDNIRWCWAVSSEHDHRTTRRVYVRATPASANSLYQLFVLRAVLLLRCYRVGFAGERNENLFIAAFSAFPSIGIAPERSVGLPTARNCPTALDGGGAAKSGRELFGRMYSLVMYVVSSSTVSNFASGDDNSLLLLDAAQRICVDEVLAVSWFTA